ncbi:MAG: glycosyltransferase [Proteobacteria bacterium]|nr:glycosyltransferase [Pseudomonadota bacterium]
MSQLRISLITVSFNSAKTIAQTIESVLAQDYPNIEYIIIDGASTDGTQDIVKQYAHNITIFKSEPDKGIYDAMNKGIQLATGDLIGMLNADDVYANEKVISLVAKCFENNAVDACYGDLIYFQDKEPNKVLRYWKSSDFKRGLFSKGWCPPHPTFFVRRKIYLQYGLFNTDYPMGNDVELMMRFLEKERIQSRYIPTVLVKMRAGGVSNKSMRNIFIQNKSILQAARALNVPFSLFQFIVGKVFSRCWQFIQKPHVGENYVK